MNGRVVILSLLLAAAASGEWVSIGPDGGSAHVLALDPQNPSHLLAGSRGLLLYQSQDAGESWHILGDFGDARALYHAALNVVAIDPTDSTTFYAGISSEKEAAGLYKSTDAGKTWKHIPSSAGVSIYCLAFWKSDPKVMAAGTNRGIYRSSDAGETWESIAQPNIASQGFMSIAIDPKDSKIIYGGTPHLPWKTSDGGKSWHVINAGISDDSDVFSIYIDQRNREHIYASACSGIYRTYNAGAQWSKFAGIPFSNRRTHVISQDPKHPATLYAATTLGIWKSTDSGADWHHISQDSINAMVIDPNGVMYLAVDQRGLIKSTDSGETYHEINNGYIERTITTMETGGDPRHSFLYASTVYDGRWGGLFRTDEVSDKWELLANEEMLHGKNLTSFAALSGTESLVAASYDGFLRSKDNGRTWMDMASGKAPEPPKAAASKTKSRPAPRPAPKSSKTAAPPAFPSPKIHIYSLKASNGKQPFLLAATSVGLYYSTTGDDWKPMPIVAKRTLEVSDIFVSPGNSGGLAAITPAGLYLSHDSGKSWQSSTIPYEPDAIYEIAFDFVDPNLLLAATSLGIYQSIDGGKTWIFHRGGLQEGKVTAVVFHPLHRGEAYVLQNGWIYQSVDAGVPVAEKGLHWKVFDRSGLGNVTFSTIAFDLSNSTPQLYGLASLRGVFAYHTHAVEPASSVPPHPHSTLN